MPRRNVYIPLDLELLAAEDALATGPSLATNGVGYDMTPHDEPRSHRLAQKLLRKRVIVGVVIVAALAVAITLLAVLVPRHQQNHRTRDAPKTVPVQAANSGTEQPWVEGHQDQSSSSDSSSRSDAGGTNGQDSSSSSSSSEESSSSEVSSLPMAYQFTLPGVGYTYTPPGPDMIKCVGDDLRCGVAHPEPVDEFDFRNKSRRAQSTRGMVAADNSRCSEIGTNILAKRGNAVDAAVAVALCQGVVSPVSSGIGGGAFIMIRWHNGTAEFINARETAPAAANATMYEGKDRMASIDGGLAVAVPLELKGLYLAWQRWGTLPWYDLVMPAQQLAEEGFAAHPYLVYAMSGPFTLKRLKANKRLRESFLIPVNDSEGTTTWRLPYVGELCCKRPLLAETLHKVAKNGPYWVYHGEAAQQLAREVQEAGGILTAEDLKSSTPEVQDPLTVEVGPLDLVIPPPPSSAAVVAFCLKFLSGYGDSALDTFSSSRGYGTTDDASSSSSSSSETDGSNCPGAAAAAEAGDSGGEGDAAAAAAAIARCNTTTAGAAESKKAYISYGVDPEREGGLGLQRMVECMKHGFAIRTALGDPGTKENPSEHAASIKEALGDLLNDDFIEELRRKTKDDWILDDDQYGGKWNPKGFTPPHEDGTSHFNVVDQWGNAVSITSTVNIPFGSAVVSPSTGILFNDEMDDFAQPNKSTAVTPHAAEANFIAPGRRPLSAMSPTFVVERSTNRLVAVAGASGGPLIVSATLQTLVRLFLDDTDVAQAVAAPRVHDQLLPKSDSMYEDYKWGFTTHQLSPVLIEELTQRGQSVAAESFALGISQAIAVVWPELEPEAAITQEKGPSPSRRSASVPQRPTLYGMGDPRKDGAAMGV